MTGVVFVFALLVGGSPPPDIVFAAAKLRQDHGSYFPIETSHLYRMHLDGSGVTQITFGDDDDLMPRIAKDRKSIRFLRRDKDDLAGASRICSVGLDGKGLRRLQTVKSPPVASQGAIEKEIVAVQVALGATIESAYDVDNSPSIYSKEGGGRSVSVSIMRLDDKTLASGFYDEDPSLFGFISAKTNKVLRLVHVTHTVKGQVQKCDLFESTQWRNNGDAAKAFRFRPGREEILLQSVRRTQDGGKPAIYCFRADNGNVRFELADEFLEDADPARSLFLTTTWILGKGSGVDDAVPLQRLKLWDGRAVHSKPVGFDLMSCSGACFVPVGR